MSDSDGTRPRKISGSQQRQRTRRVNVPLSPAEMERVRHLAAGSGYSAGALVRHHLLGLPLPRRRRTPLADLAAVADLRTQLGFIRSELGKIGSNVNQIAHQLNAKEGVLPPYVEGAMSQLEETLRMFAELRDAYMRALGGESASDDD